ncbi:hypothetical protein LIX17_06770 [Mycobacterium avium subsp. hominissuis]|uniref:hypothetical protein n=1 Tax=Mycobacterium avium TaxID=1764 RepID=UPI001140F78C|nr:hypothetical protein [Mycobacterium avium]
MPQVMPLAESRARAERVAYLRAVVGMSWSKIRDELGFKSVGAAQQAYKTHRRRNPVPGGEAVFADLIDRHQHRNQQGMLALAKAQAANDYSGVASLIRTLQSNDAELAKWFGISAETVNVNVKTSSATEIIAEARERLLAVVDAEVIEPKEIEQ